MRLNRPPGVARNPVHSTRTAGRGGRRRGSRPSAGAIGVMAATALTAAALALWAIPAGASAHQPAAPASAAKKHASHTTVSAKPKTAKVGASVRLSATVTSSGKTPKGSVTFSAGGKKLCDARLSKGSAHCDAKFSAQDVYEVKGTYSGDSKHRGSWGATSVPVNRYTTTTAVAVSTKTPTAGNPVTLSATVSSKSKAAPTGTVNFTGPGGALCSGKLTAGKAHCTYTWPTAGAPQTVTGTYKGDAAHAGSSGTVSVTGKLITTGTTAAVNMATPYPGQSVTLTATVTPAAATGTVSFSDAGGHLCTGPLAGGTAQCAYTWAAKGGPYTITATYSGDATHAPSAGTAAATVTVTQLATTTQITAPNPIATEPAGTPYTVMVTVTSATGPVPTGTVDVEPTNLTDPGPGFACTATLDGAGNGSCTVDPPVGTFGFTLFQATYSGDAAHLTSQTPVTDEHKLITPDITTTTVTPATATSGDPVTLKATIVDQAGTSLLAGEGGPDLVNFSVNDTVVCADVAVTYTGGANIATCSYTPPTATSYSVEADYLGDDYALPSTGTETLVAS